MRATLQSLTLLAATVALATSLAAHAQSTWPQPGTHVDYGTLEVVTLANPGHRHYCRVHAITAAGITCGVGLARKPVLYRRDDVATILAPVNHLGEHFLAILGTETGVTLLVVASILAPAPLSFVLAAAAISYGICSAIFPHPTWHAEYVLYQRPNTTRTLTLRTH